MSSPARPVPVETLDPAAFAARYRAALGLEGDDEAARKRRERAWEKAHDLRKFEIDLYWRRSSYYWGFQIAFFAGAGTALSRVGAADVHVFTVVFLCLTAAAGLVSAAAWHLAERGSKAWQDNWERQVEMLEDEFTGALYKSAFLRTAEARFGPVSVSRVNSLFSLFVGVFWLAILLLALVHALSAGGFHHALGALALLVFLGLAGLHLAIGPPFRLGIIDRGAPVAASADFTLTLRPAARAGAGSDPP